MNNLFSKIRDKHALWYKVIIFIACVFICAYLLPKKNAWEIVVPKAGEIWKADNLVSKLEFLVSKTEAEIKTEKELKQFPYFRKKTLNSDSIINELNISNSIKHQFKLFLDSVSNMGIFPLNPETTYIQDSIYMVNDNEVSLIATSKLLRESDYEPTIRKFCKDSSEVNRIVKLLSNNLLYDAELNQTDLLSENNSISIYKSKIHEGETLAEHNDVLTNRQVELIENYKMAIEARDHKSPWNILGKLITTCLILGIMMLFLAYFRRVIFSQNTHVTFILMVIVLIELVTRAVYSYNPKYVYAVPFCLVPILIRVFFDSRTALFNFLNVVLLCAFFTEDKFEFVFVQLIAGIGTIFSVADMGRRSKLFFSSMLALLFYISSYTAYHLINNTTSSINNIDNFLPFVISASCVLFAFPLIFIFEKLFGFVSDFTLLELCDLNSPLLRELSQKVPGTFQHSLQVANLAEEACYKIGGNALLVRTGAMYHDIGKMEHPRYFTENQVGEVSPHSELSAEESAQIIIGHVIKGIEIAKENKLPEAVIDFIRTHHGTTTTKYFLHHYKKLHEGERINEDLFKYPGPIPFSKETAILMMADGVEASSRSLKKYDAIAIDELVDRIIDYQISENQFLNADITFRDINQIKKIFKKRLMNIYHVRIEYPR